jgi:hypothetical protein
MELFNRIVTTRPRVYQQRPWTDQQLVAMGFCYYPPVKRPTLVRPLPADEAPKTIETPWDTIVADAGYIIAYSADDDTKKSLDDYEPRPIEPNIFELTYKPWDDPNWKPTPAEQHLIDLGCKPYYKTVGVWAKKLKHDTYVQSRESSKPTLAPAGLWLCIGVAGEPWTVTEDWFFSRYEVDKART